MSWFNYFVRDEINELKRQNADRQAQEDADVAAGRIERENQSASCCIIACQLQNSAHQLDAAVECKWSCVPEKHAATSAGVCLVIQSRRFIDRLHASQTWMAFCSHFCLLDTADTTVHSSLGTL